MSEPVELEYIGDVAIIRLNQPDKGNALSLSLSEALLQAAEHAASNPDVRCVVLTGRGRFFCVGGDIAAFAAAGQAADGLLRKVTGHLNAAILRLAQMDKPLVVAVNGPAAGAGIGLAAMGDIVLSNDNAHFTMAYTAVGLTPDGGTSSLLPRLIGLRKTQELALTNRRVSADEACAIGLVTRVVPAGTLDDEAMALARHLAAGPTTAFAAVRRLLDQAAGAPLASQLEREADAICAAVISDDGQEGMNAFLAKRPAQFGTGASQARLAASS